MRSRIVVALIATLFICPALAVAKPRITVDNGPDPVSTGSSRRVFITGYGELYYNNIDNADDVIDFKRFVLGFGYDFSERIRFRSEIEFEHAAKEVELEYAYFDFDVVPAFNVRAGAFLLPIGPFNQTHEPTAFYSVLRPEIQSFIIPTTWWEGGAGFYGDIVDGLHYQVYGHSSLNYNKGSADDEFGFNGGEGIRPGRQKLTEIKANSFAGSARLEYDGVTGLSVGASGFVGGTAQGDPRVSGGLVTLVEADAKYAFEGIELQGLIATLFNPDAGAMTTAQRADGNIGAAETIGSRMLGFMFEGAYHVFHHVWRDAPVDLIAFARWESYDTQSAVPSGFAKDPANDRNTYTFGLSFLPLDQIAIKADYSVHDNAANTGNNQFDVGLGYYF